MNTVIENKCHSNLIYKIFLQSHALLIIENEKNWSFIESFIKDDDFQQLLEKISVDKVPNLIQKFDYQTSLEVLCYHCAKFEFIQFLCIPYFVGFQTKQIMIP